MSQDTSNSSALPEKISFKDRYIFLRKLGAGGMGEVHQANDTVLDKKVAVKILLPGMSSSAVVRFQKEAKAAARLDHLNIVKVLDFGQTEAGDLYLVMDFVGNKNLEQFIKKSKYVPVEKALPILSQVAAGLQHAHSHGVLHRDVKPSNVMISEAHEGRVQIVDFGLAKLQTEDQKLTSTGIGVGSPLYMSPEQANGAEVDARSDIYSLGCVIYKMLTGSPPLQGETMFETIEKQQNETPRPLNENKFALVFPGALQHIIDKTLAKDPAERYQTAQDLNEALDDVYEHLRAHAVRVNAENFRSVEPAPRPVAKPEILVFFKTYSKSIALCAYAVLVLAAAILAVTHRFIGSGPTKEATAYDANEEKIKRRTLEEKSFVEMHTEVQHEAVVDPLMRTPMLDDIDSQMKEDSSANSSGIASKAKDTQTPSVTTERDGASMTDSATNNTRAKDLKTIAASNINAKMNGLVMKSQMIEGGPSVDVRKFTQQMLNNKEFRQLREDTEVEKSLNENFAKWQSPEMMRLHQDPDFIQTYPVLDLLWSDPKLSKAWRDKEVLAFVKSPRLWREWNQNANNPAINKCKRNKNICLLMKDRRFLFLIESPRYKRLVFNMSFRKLVLDDCVVYSKMMRASQSLAQQMMQSGQLKINR